MPPDPPGRLIAAGRAASVYDLGDGTVLRRYTSPHDGATEGRAMRWLREHGVATPRVHHADDLDIVMDLVVGPTMLADIEARPWRVLRHSRLLARLQRTLNEIVAPAWFPTKTGVAAGCRVLHLDLHPMNVIISPDGPVIIDWTNVACGDPQFDAAMSYVVMSSYEATGMQERIGQRLIVDGFRLARGRDDIRDALPAAVAFRMRDPNVTEGERAKLLELLDG